MVNIWEKAISILAGNLNSGLSYLITAVKSRSIFSKVILHPSFSILQIKQNFWIYNKQVFEQNILSGKTFWGLVKKSKNDSKFQNTSFFIGGQKELFFSQATEGHGQLNKR